MSARVGSRASRRDLVRRLRRRPLGLAGLIGAGLFVLIAVVGPWVSPFDPLALRPETLQPPGAPYWFGTDDVGRDILSGVLHGARVSLLVGLLSALGAVVIGVAVGTLAGYCRGRVDAVLMRATEWVLVVPQFLIVLVVAAIFGADLRLVVAVIAAVSWPTTARLTRAQFLALAEREFVTAARGLGSSDPRIALRQILPNALAQIVVTASLQIPAAILSEASLRFLGLSDPSRLSWGGMLNQAQNFLQQSWWMAFFPGIAIFLTVLSFNLAGEALNEALDPRR
ncbi:MAG TPA: ABC transporter permease [Thermoleophilaceae bacterium]|nr:ABC transporter permease [Thermoleophilaceae bacterium]